MKPQIYIINNNHFDLCWRRCFNRDIEYKGRFFVSYGEIQKQYIMDNIDICDKYPEYHFEIESVAVLKNFLLCCPQYEPKIKALLKSGRLFMPFSGINIVDSNMVSGESIVRNYLYGYRYLKEKFDYIGKGLDRNDAFGNSAQLPQIARKFGVNWVCNIAYSPCTAAYWRGLDGSVLFNVSHFIDFVGETGGYYKYRPCPACGGNPEIECEVCGGRRIDTEFQEKLRSKITLSPIKERELPYAVMCGGEEILPSEYIVNWAKENKDKYDISFADYSAFADKLKDKTDIVDCPPEDEVFGSVECNCNNTGTFSTRIKLKQSVRNCESRMSALEGLCAMNYLCGKEYPFKSIEDIWYDMLFTMFHDSITSTHVDAVYDELLDTFEAIDTAQRKLICDTVNSLVSKKEGIITVINPYGVEIDGFAKIDLAEDEIPVFDGEKIPFIRNGAEISFAAGKIEAFGKKEFAVIKGENNTELLYDGGEMPLFAGTGSVLNNDSNSTAGNDIDEVFCIENEFYKVAAKNSGITEIYDKRIGTVAKKSEYFIGEIILEHDEGSPWATLSPDMRRKPLSQYTRILKYSKGETTESITFGLSGDTLDAYSVSGLKCIVTVSLLKGVNKVLFDLCVDWDTQNHRIRMAFPTLGEGRHFYEIPYGILERKPYENNIVFPDGSTNWASAAGDYPAINWAGVCHLDHSVAILNRGTPAYMITPDKNKNDTVFVTLLRSPSVGTYLHSPIEYSMTEYDGMRDAGKHSFSLAFEAFEGELVKSNVVKEAIGFNASLVATDGKVSLPAMPKLTSENAVITSVKAAEDNSGLILRLNEIKGMGEEVSVEIPGGFYKAFVTDLKEDIINELSIENGTVKTKIGAFEILTLKLMR